SGSMMPIDRGPRSASASDSSQNHARPISHKQIVPYDLHEHTRRDLGASLDHEIATSVEALYVDAVVSVNPVLIAQVQRLESRVGEIEHRAARFVFVGDVPEVKTWIEVVVLQSELGLFVRWCEFDRALLHHCVVEQH